VRIFLLSVMPTRPASGKSRSMRVGFHTGTHRLRVAEEDILLLGKENVLNVRENASANHDLSFEAIFRSFNLL
jgi:hypothetical protein